MFDSKGNRIEAGMFLRDVRFGQTVFFLVTQVIYNTGIIGLETHLRSEGYWQHPSRRQIEGTYNYAIVPAGAVPGRALAVLVERASYEAQAKARDEGRGWSVVDRETAYAIWSEAGYNRWSFVLTENESHTRTFANASGYTHAKTAPNDHYWRLIAVGGKWYFAVTD